MTAPHEKAQSNTWRVFCAINLPPAVHERVQQHITRLRASVPEARVTWNFDDKLHLTIKFLGDMAPERVGDLSLAAAQAVSAIKPFTLAAEGCGAFPPRGEPRVLWIGIVDAAGELEHLYERLEEQCSIQGFTREQRPFRPHLTIARVRKPQDARRLATSHKELGFGRTEFSVSELVVIRSELGSEGSRYTELSRHLFGA
ncbi:MAG TPA: RNA 2',3'-cyclic phosphodiesterase [Pyrinomonadaceae bacterium]